ncbi:GPO family capsid scaffolding protein [Sphingomonas phyllosphaerae]|uniref:GPO family capsid scaffolding protein n=1 Tax=Sphingomonas phyllosphaerae TaxID=257003 RepID=UPI002413C824|nr:GPO family capsid scaffolding protein [Sphingomonas phyllosphaerae]
MGQKSQFFRCFVAGNTISDGRTITPEMIDQVVETFDPATYSPRINVEHVKGFSPEPPFNGYGDVVAVRAQDDAISVGGTTETRRALYAQVDANPQLVRLARGDQKPFPSVELTDSYAGTGKFGLVGLAFTDSPASIATQRLSFSRHAPGTVFAQGDEAVALELSASDPAGIAEAIRSGFAAVAALFARAPEKPTEPEAETPPTPPTPANDNNAAFAAALGASLATSVSAAVQPIADAQAAVRRDLDALAAKLATEPAEAFRRAPATGAGATHLTDF